MTTSNLVRWGASGFVLGGVVWLVMGLVSAFAVNPMLLMPGSVLFYYYAALGALARLLLGVGMVGLHALQKGSYARIGRAGFYAVLVAIAVLILSLLAALAVSPTLGGLESLVGQLLLIVGFVLYGVASLQARVLPRWYAMVLLAFVLISALLAALAPPGSSNIWMGAVLLVLGLVLWRRSEAPAEQPPRVR
jgi:hypothetical protein